MPVMPPVPVMPPAPVVTMVPAHLGGHLPRSKLLIILERRGGARIDQRRRSSLLGRRGQNQQRDGCGKAQNSRHGHHSLLLIGRQR